MSHGEGQGINHNQPLLRPLVVVGPQFVLPYPVDLTIVRKVMSLLDGNYVVTNVEGNLIFKVHGKIITLHDRRILLDANDKPVVCFHRKLLSAHKRWQVFRGDKSHYKDLLFTAKQSSMIQYKTSVDVFLASNTKEQVCDFKVKGSWLEKSCTVYAGESSTILAQMQKKYSIQSVAQGKETFSVTVFPNVDYAFIVALVVMLEDVSTDTTSR